MNLVKDYNKIHMKPIIRKLVIEEEKDGVGLNNSIRMVDRIRKYNALVYNRSAKKEQFINSNFISKNENHSQKIIETIKDKEKKEDSRELDEIQEQEIKKLKYNLNNCILFLILLNFF